MFTEKTSAVSRFTASWPDNFNPTITKRVGISNGDRDISIRCAGNELDPWVEQPGPIQLFSIMFEDYVVDSKLLKLELNKGKAQGLSKRDLKLMKEDLVDGGLEKDKKIKITQVLFNKGTREVFISAKDGSVLEECILFLSGAQKIGFTNACPMSHFIKESALDGKIPELKMFPAETHPEFEASYETRFGRSFLTYLWGQSMIAEEPFFYPCDQISLKGESLGSKVVKIEGGIAMRSQELAKSLKQGKLVSSLKLSILPESLGFDPEIEQPFTFSMDDNFQVSGLKFPKQYSSADFNRGAFNYLTDVFDKLNSEVLNCAEKLRGDEFSNDLKKVIQS